ncbi:patatin-like phospholipase family protein [Marininema halotolerans]|uniref:Patatin-like phospholipase/acyl hydrolase n=1 Tax=Marininema halotolerans TaxID=1155944 RepID=A0A1I6NT29_9BACL|nr:patatin-like phospholipase family protein [Marininema halotolerans]SFS31081.1 Patatin-like phospholipase/acyl hydrolase [Marininema halotolerans]
MEPRGGKYRIISIDGGGVRGIIPTTFLERLVKRFPNLIQSADLLAGTSSGSFTSLGLASGKTPAVISQFFEEKAPIIFSNPRQGIVSPIYSNVNLIDSIRDFLSTNYRLNELRQKVVVPSFLKKNQANVWQPVLFNNFPHSRTSKRRVRFVSLASSAAPVYFPSYAGFIDGGVVATNPSMAALSLALDRQAGRQHPMDIVMISIGTGFNPYYLPLNTPWGALQWNRNPNQDPFQPESPLLTVQVDGANEVTTQYSQHLLGKKFFRLNLNLKANKYPLDDASSIPALRAMAEQANLAGITRFIRQQWF